MPVALEWRGTQLLKNKSANKLALMMAYSKSSSDQQQQKSSSA